jgi:hypothetical protein
VSDFKERTIEPVTTSYARSGASLPMFRDVETGEVFKIYAGDLLRLLEGMAFTVNAKTISAGYRQQALRIAK